MMSLPFFKITNNEDFEDVLQGFVALLHSTVHVLVFFYFSDKNLILPDKILCDTQRC